MPAIELSTILSPQRTLCGAVGNSKKRVLEKLAQLICEDSPVISSNELFDKLIARERLGSTGLGNGIAIPHCRIKNCLSITGTLVKLHNPIDFDAIDGEKVDLLFVLLVPEEAHDDHLLVLSTLAEKFSSPEYCERLRSSGDNDSLYQAAIAN